MDEIRFVAGPIIQRQADKVEAERQAAQQKEEEIAMKKQAEIEAKKRAEEEVKRAEEEKRNAGKEDAEMKDAGADEVKGEVEEVE